MNVINSNLPVKYLLSQQRDSSMATSAILHFGWLVSGAPTFEIWHHSRSLINSNSWLTGSPASHYATLLTSPGELARMVGWLITGTLSLVIWHHLVILSKRRGEERIG